MHDRLVVRTHLNGLVAVVASRGAAISGAILDPGADVRKTVDAVLANLPDEVPPAALPAERWLKEVAKHKLTPTACRAAMIFAVHADGQWLGVAAMGADLQVGFRQASKATRALLNNGLLERTTEGTRALYRRRLP